MHQRLALLRIVACSPLMAPRSEGDHLIARHLTSMWPSGLVLSLRKHRMVHVLHSTCEKWRAPQRWCLAPLLTSQRDGNDTGVAPPKPPQGRYAVRNCISFQGLLLLLTTMSDCRTELLRLANGRNARAYRMRTRSNIPTQGSRSGCESK
ncbi:hypothetical protein BS47DRAFT_367332 [Hydnum rufescens UP504]|uniref:Uncharacterized protein n=1 Tax=Hydnum rufescens UP504 TaxID=1448309 RepID=A0A9P6DQU0_9AGAM|nr:hypothetical protein BS47DRAFT_367332 [Hydnum rufescens UP504]